MYDDTEWGWWLMSAGILVGLLLLAASMALAVVMTRSHGSAADEPSLSAGASAALAALDLRLARGEVDEDGYRRLRQLLLHPADG